MDATDIGVIAAQNIDFLLAARRAFQELPSPEKEAWLGLAYLGVGVSVAVRPLVDQKTLTAAVITATTIDVALEMLVQTLDSKTQPKEHNFVAASSYPDLISGVTRKKFSTGKSI